MELTNGAGRVAVESGTAQVLGENIGFRIETLQVHCAEQVGHRTDGLGTKIVIGVGVGGLAGRRAVREKAALSATHVEAGLIDAGHRRIFGVQNGCVLPERRDRFLAGGVILRGREHSHPQDRGKYFDFPHGGHGLYHRSLTGRQSCPPAAGDSSGPSFRPSAACDNPPATFLASHVVRAGRRSSWYSRIATDLRSKWPVTRSCSAASASRRDVTPHRSCKSVCC